MLSNSTENCAYLSILSICFYIETISKGFLKNNRGDFTHQIQKHLLSYLGSLSILGSGKAMVAKNLSVWISKHLLIWP